MRSCRLPRPQPRARRLAPPRASILLWIVVGAIGAPPASAQSERVLGRDDVNFARELYRKGWSDLAATLCETIEKAGKTSNETEQIGLKGLHLDLRFDLARGEDDPIKRKDLMKTILQEKEDLIRRYPTSKTAEDATTSLPDVYRSIGETITIAIQKETDPGLIVQLREEGEKIYSQAEEQFKARIEELAADHSTPDQERAYVNLLFNLPRTYYYHSLLYPPGEWKKKDLLEKAKEGFQVFGLDYQDTLLNYEGLVLMGLADKDLGKNEDALADFDDAIALASFFEKDEKGRYQVSQDVADTVSGAVLQKVLFQTELKDYAGAVATAKQFFDEIPEAHTTRRGLAVLAARADAEVAAGDTKAAEATANLLIEKDERGPWGAKGREVQAKILGAGGGNLDASSILAIAARQADLGKDAAAIEICHKAVAAVRGTPKEADVSCDAFLMIGKIYMRRGPGWAFEAALAYDTAAERWPKAAKAAEAVYQSMLSYSRLNGDDKRPWLKKRVDERLKTLLTQYPTDARSHYAQLEEGKDLERENKYLEAARLYEQIQPGTPSYLEAQFRAGNAYFRQAHTLCGAKKEGEAGQFVKQAETILKKAMTDLEGAAQGTMDLEAQARFSSTAFQARAALAQLYLMECVNKPADVMKVLENVEERYADDAEKIATAWTFRISALQKQGKLDEAVALLDTLVKRDPASRAIGTAAGLIARALDAKAQELEKAGKARESDEQQKRAAAYYAMSGRALAKSGMGRAKDITDIADRLLALTFEFNEVPAQWDSFVGWDASKTREQGMWKDTAELYEAALAMSPNYQSQIKLARVLGFQGQYAEASTVLARLFDSEPITVQEADGGPPKFNAQLIREKRELYPAYLEWGVAALEAAIAEKDAELFLRADSIFANLVRQPAPDNPIWWHAKHQQIRSLTQQGKYGDAQLVLRAVERENTKLGVAAGLEDEFKALQTELKAKAPTDKSPTDSRPK